MSNPEWVITLLLTVSTFLFAWGGGGAKWARRFVLPIILAYGAFYFNIHWVRCLIALLLMIGGFWLPYGNKSPLWKKAFATLAFGACLLPLVSGINALLCLIPVITFGCGYYLSLRFNWFTWKIVEAATGFSLGGTVILLSLTY